MAKAMLLVVVVWAMLLFGTCAEHHAPHKVHKVHKKDVFHGPYMLEADEAVKVVPITDQSHGEVVHSRNKDGHPHFTTEYSAAEIIHRIGDFQDQDAKTAKDTSRHDITFPMRIYRNTWDNDKNNERISDFGFGETRLTDNGDEYFNCQPPLGAKITKIGFCLTNVFSAIKRFAIETEINGWTNKCEYYSRTGHECTAWLLDTTGLDLRFSGIQIMQSGAIINTMKIFQARPNPAVAAGCSMQKMVALVQSALTGTIVTQSRSTFEGRSFVSSSATSIEASVTASVKEGISLFGVGVEVETKVSASYGYVDEKTTSDDTGRTRTSSVTIDLTDRMMITYLLQMPCELTMQGGKKSKALAPFDSRVRRLIMPMEMCLSTADTTETTRQGGSALEKNTNAKATTTGSIDFSVGSCVLPDKYQWFDPQSALEDVSHLVDIPSSHVLTNIENIVVLDPKPAKVY